MTQKTKDRILDAAEELYSEYGFADTSMRELTQKAGVNLAAVNYHFGSKEGLFRALVARRFAPINAERIERLDALEAKGDPTLEEVLEALVAPILALRFRDPGGASQLVQIIGRLTSAKDCHAEELGESFRQTSVRFMGALLGVLPVLPERQMKWRLNCVVGVMIGTLLDPHDFLGGGGASEDPEYQEQLLAFIVNFISAALSAPFPIPSTKS